MTIMGAMIVRHNFVVVAIVRVNLKKMYEAHNLSFSEFSFDVFQASRYHGF